LLNVAVGVEVAVVVTSAVPVAGAEQAFRVAVLDFLVAALEQAFPEVRDLEAGRVESSARVAAVAHFMAAAEAMRVVYMEDLDMAEVMVAVVGDGVAMDGVLVLA
jgi:hypothetical protein